MSDSESMMNEEIERTSTSPDLVRLGVTAVSIGGAAALGGVAGGVTGAGLGAALGFALLGPAGASVGFLIGIIGGALVGALAAGLSANWIRYKLEHK